MKPEDITYDMPEPGSTEQKAMSTKPFRQVMGIVLYAVGICRMDLAFTAAFLSRFMHNPSQHHWNCVLNLLGYIKAHPDEGITFGKNKDKREKNLLQIYSDSNFAQDTIDRSSISGFALIFAGAAFGVKSKKQSTTATSTAEAEYIALFAAVLEAIYYRYLLEFVGLKQNFPTSIYEDNTAAINIANNQVAHSRTKSWDIKYHRIRQALKDQDVNISYVPSEKNLADPFTKPLVGSIFAKVFTWLFGRLFGQ